MSAQTSTTSKRARRWSMCKTLKDIEAQGGAVELWELKAEAVKWVKFNFDLKNKQKPGQIINEMNLEGRIWMLGHFFNLTEEDLA